MEYNMIQAYKIAKSHRKIRVEVCKNQIEYLARE